MINRREIFKPLFPKNKDIAVIQTIFTFDTVQINQSNK